MDGLDQHFCLFEEVEPLCQRGRVDTALAHQLTKTARAFHKIEYDHQDPLFLQQQCAPDECKSKIAGSCRLGIIGSDLYSHTLFYHKIMFSK